MKMIAKYLRYSFEDMKKLAAEGKTEGDSITSQRELIDQYIKEHKDIAALPAIEFCDDGYTGTSFERPQFQNMIEQVREGKITCIIMKDLSRLGRNYIEAGDYLEHIFPFLGVRVISINDGYDSARLRGGTTEIAFRNLINDLYSKDLSHKVKSSMRVQMQKGRFVNTLPYGYQRSPADKHVMIPDKATAPIVQEIFRRVLAGESSGAIAADFNARQIPPPSVYKAWRTADERIWTRKAILSILHNLKYTGAAVSHKLENRVMRDSNPRRVPESEWIIRENMHEALVSKADFEAAGAMLKTHRKPKTVRAGRKSNGTYDRVYYCGHCGRKLQKIYGLGISFYCDAGQENRQSDCRYIRFDKAEMEQVLLRAYRLQMTLIERRQLQQRRSGEQARDLTARLAALTKRLEGCKTDRLIVSYEDYRAGKLSREDFIQQKAQLAAEQEQLKQEIAELEQRREAEHAGRMEQREREETLAAYLTCTDEEQTIRQMYQMISRVTVYDNQDIEVKWAFGDLFSGVS